MAAFLSTAAREACAPVTLAVLLLAVAVALRRGAGIRLGWLGPFGVGFLIVWETLLLNVLSLFRAVTPGAVLLGNGVALVVAAFWLRQPGREALGLLREATRRAMRARWAWLVAPLAGLLLVIACVYPPTTHDAMTYHLARVAYWIQNQSIAFYPSAIDRQNWMPPGAEYLILLLQLIAGSDRWANGVQWLAWALSLTAVPGLCRVAGVPRRLCPWALVFVAALPMGILQATSTQTDMVGALMTLGLVGACLPLLHDPRRWSRRALTPAILMAAAAYLVKPTALLAAAPVPIVACIRWLRRPGLLRAQGLRLVRCALPALVVAACAVGPHALRAAALLRDPACLASPAHPRFQSFDRLGDGSERLLNPLLATYAHHSVGREAALRAVQAAGFEWSPRAVAVLARRPAWVLHEDLAGNPLHAFVGAILLAWVVLVARRVPRKALLFACVPFAAWVLFHLFVRNQAWVSRLQLPLFMLLPLAWAAAASPALPRFRARAAALVAASLLALGVGYYDATHMLGKPVWPAALGRYPRDELYYLYRPDGAALKREHDAVLARLSAAGGTRLGLVLGVDDYDYPLAWRAMRQGVEVRHCARRSPWPDVVFATQP